MVLPASGPISINDVATEFGGDSPHSLTEYYRDTSFIVRNNVPTGEAGTTNPNNALVPHRRFTYGNEEVTEITIPEDAFSTGTTRTGEVYIAPTGSSGNVPQDSDVPITPSSSGTLTPTFSGGNNGVTDTSTPNEDVDVDTTITPQSVSSMGANGSSGSYTISQNNAGETFSATWTVNANDNHLYDVSTLTGTEGFSNGTNSGGDQTDGSYFASSRVGPSIQIRALTPTITIPSGVSAGGASIAVSVDASGMYQGGPGNIWGGTLLIVPSNASVNSNWGTGNAGQVVNTGSLSPDNNGTSLVDIIGSASAIGSFPDNVPFRRAPLAAFTIDIDEGAVTIPGLSGGQSFRIYYSFQAFSGQGGSAFVAGDTTISWSLTGSQSGTALGGLPNGNTVNGSRVPTSYSIPSSATNISGDGTAGQTITGGNSVISVFETGSLTGGIAGGAGPESRTLPNNTTNTHYFFSSVDAGLTQSGRTVTAGASTLSGNTLSGVTVANIVNNTGVALSNVSITFTESKDNGTIQYSVDNGNFGNGPTVNLGSFTAGQSKTVRANLTVNAVLNVTTSVSEMFTIAGTRTVTRFSYLVTNNASVSVDVTLNPQDGNAVTITLAPSATRADVVFSRFNTLSASAIDFSNTNPSSFTITVDGTVSEELILPPGLSGVGLREGVRDLLRTSTLANNFSSIIVDRATISGTATDIVRLVFDDSDTHSFTAAFTNNNGTLANTSSFGNLVNPGAAATPSTIMFTADNTEQTPNSFSLTLGRVDTAEGIAEAVNDMINTLNTNNITFTLSSTVVGRVVTVVDSIRRAQRDVTLTVTTAGTSNLAFPTSIINVTTPGTDDTDVTINGNVPTSGTISLTNFYNGSAT